MEALKRYRTGANRRSSAAPVGEVSEAGSVITAQTITQLHPETETCIAGRCRRRSAQTRRRCYRLAIRDKEQRSSPKRVNDGNTFDLARVAHVL